MFEYFHLDFNFTVTSHIKHVEGSVDESEGRGQQSQEEAVVVVGDEAVLSDHVEDAVLGRGLVEPGLGQPLLGDLLVNAGPCPGVDGAVGSDGAEEIHGRHHDSLLS